MANPTVLAGADVVAMVLSMFTLFGIMLAANCVFMYSVLKMVVLGRPMLNRGLIYGPDDDGSRASIEELEGIVARAIEQAWVEVRKGEEAA